MARLGLLFLVLFLLADDALGEIQVRSCERITLPLCHNLGYNLTIIRSGDDSRLLPEERVSCLANKNDAAL